MIVKTKRYQLDNKTYIRLAMENILKEWWWVWLIPSGMIVLGGVMAAIQDNLSWFWWFFGTAIVLSILYLIFWAIQFTGVTQLEQTKMLFEKLSYEIDSRQILIRLDAKRGMPLTWDKILKAKMTNEYFLLILSKAQFIYLPFAIFKSDNEVRFIESILRRKNFLAAKAAKPVTKTTGEASEK